MLSVFITHTKILGSRRRKRKRRRKRRGRKEETLGGDGCHLLHLGGDDGSMGVYLQIYQVMSVKYVQLFLCQSYLNKVLKGTLSQLSKAQMRVEALFYLAWFQASEF